MWLKLMPLQTTVLMRFVRFRDKSTHALSRAAYKVYIIDEVHMLSTGDTFNALWRLRRTNWKCVFILATTGYIRFLQPSSRVQRFEFKSIKQGAIKAFGFNSGKRRINLDDEALTIIARRAEGMRCFVDLRPSTESFLWQSCQSSCSWRNHWFYWFNSLRQFHVRNQETTQAYQISKLFDNGKSMSRFATDLWVFPWSFWLSKWRREQSP